jgi:hypothetical protein
MNRLLLIVVFPEFVLTPKAMYMKFCDFLFLSPDLQKKLLWQEGVYLCSRNEGRLLFELYQLGEFYVEVCLEFCSRRIIQYRKSKSTMLLASYLPYIRLPLFLQRINS